MNKKLITGVVVGMAVVVAVAKSRSASTGPKVTMADRMRKCMEDMPEDFPPRVMFDNVEATRATSERILDLLEQQTKTDHSSIDDIELVPTS